MADTISIDAARPEVWSKKLYSDEMSGMYFTANKMMGEGDNNIVQIKPELSKEQGDTITFELTSKMSNAAITGDNEAEGNEEAILPYSESVAIDQARFPVRLKGKLDEQKNAYNMRLDAKEKMKVRLQEFEEMQIFLKLAGVSILTLTNINGVVTSADAVWSNTPTLIAHADTLAGKGARYLCANAGGAAVLTIDDKLTPTLITRARIKAANSTPKIKPLKIKGKNWYILFVHSWQMADLKQNPVMHAALQNAWWRGDENPIFNTADLVWDGVIIHEHEYVPFLDISEVGYNFNSAASGTQYGYDCFRAILCGQQAIGYARCKNENSWVENTKDYKNKTGFCTGIIGGIDKILFDSKEYGCLVVDTAASDLS